MTTDEVLNICKNTKLENILSKFNISTDIKILNPKWGKDIENVEEYIYLEGLLLIDNKIIRANGDYTHYEKVLNGDVKDNVLRKNGYYTVIMILHTYGFDDNDVSLHFDFKSNLKPSEFIDRRYSLEEFIKPFNRERKLSKI